MNPADSAAPVPEDEPPFVHEECGDTMWDAVLAQPEPAAACRVTYLGGPTAILDLGGLRFLTDPTLDPPGGTYAVVPGLTVTKLAGPAAVDLGRIDVVLLSHEQHHDNLDTKGRELLQTVQLVLTTPASAARLPGNSRGLSPWESTELLTPGGVPITVTATPARHGPAGIEPASGDVTGFVLAVGGAHPFQVYLTGDTVFYAGVQEVARRFQPRYVFVFAGAAQPRGPFNVTMDTNDALDTAAAFPQATIIPLHHEGWSHYTQHGAAFAQAFSTFGLSQRLLLLTAGAPTDLPV
ncbi:MBL fold metallo-hydrolase [Hymenobacter sp. 15J16-1T3B]|uniref:MBL fold metallo-hydrolase n=1 Tax=Hymenobacter sp. 15J16-1T3B TaxID=2886941 RepID=UPI001D0FA6F9|nr:MBL fold metallo-hydrolase [Hymenobacter sp. 15J16-1T3B]MCC3159763.1 MBL fold metallo-hydrolase [Hymenobacter sp. 15J16-1T3B]